MFKLRQTEYKPVLMDQETSGPTAAGHLKIIVNQNKNTSACS